MKDRRSLLSLFTLVVVLFAASMSSAADVSAPAGVRLMLDSSGGLGQTILRVQWVEPAEEGSVVIFGPEDLRVPGWFAEASSPGSFRLGIGPVGMGETTEIELDLGSIADGGIIRVAAERHTEDGVLQVASTIRVAAGRGHMAPPHAYRIVTVSDVDSGLVEPVRTGDITGHSIRRPQSTVTIEPLDAKALETVFAWDTANRSIPRWSLGLLTDFVVVGRLAHNLHQLGAGDRRRGPRDPSRHHHPPGHG